MNNRDKKWQISHFMLMIGILCSMVNIHVLYCKASGSSLKRPDGVMSTAVYDQIAVSWEPVAGAQGYEVYEGVWQSDRTDYSVVEDVKVTKCIRTKCDKGRTYYYYVRAYALDQTGHRIYGANSKTVFTTVPIQGQSTIRNFLLTALAPMGSTMYVWGGGWNRADTGAGKETRQIGTCPRWRKFAKNKKARYNYRDYRYQIHNGLDCSGYVGWCVYNIRNVEDNRKGYVYAASKQAEKFADMGWGTYVERQKVTDYRAGDVMSSTCSCCGHVYIVIGQCKDGSVVLLHSSPAGVQISGTATPEGKVKSEAYQLAQHYMKKYYRSWYRRYLNVGRGTSYLTHYAQMRWKTVGEDIILSDPDGYQNMDASSILKDLYKE